MNSKRHSLFHLLLFAICGLSIISGQLVNDCIAQENETEGDAAEMDNGSGVSALSIEQLIDQLEAVKSDERQKAMRALIDEGEAAVSSIEIRLLQSSGVDKQAARRQMLQLGGLIRIANSQDVELKSLAEKALLRISKKGNAKVRRLAARALSKASETSEENTIELLRSKNVNVKMFRSKFAKSLPQEYDITFGRDYSGTLEDLDWLATLTEDTDVTFIGDRYNDEYMEKVVIIPSLRGVTLRQTLVTNKGVQLLETSESIRRLRIRGSDIDATVVSKIAALPRMRRLTLIETEVTRDDVIELQKLHPKLTIEWASGAFLGVNFKIDENECVLTNVLEGSGAENAGMKIGDRLVVFGGQIVNGSEDFQKAISTLEPGDTIKAAVLREGNRIEMTVTLGSYPY